MLLSHPQAFVPENIVRGQYKFGAADNIDFGNCTPDGKGTTHGRNMILYQPGGWLPEYQQTSQTADFQTPAPTSHLRRSVYAHKSINGMKRPSKLAGNPLSDCPDALLSEMSNPRSCDLSIAQTREWANMRHTDTTVNLAQLVMNVMRISSL